MGVRKSVTVYEAIKEALLDRFQQEDGAFFAEELESIAKEALEKAKLTVKSPYQSAKQTISDMRKEGYVIAFSKDGYAYILVKMKEPKGKKR